MKILVTGVAGFIGAKVAERLLAAGHEIIGVDNLNDYYDVRLKEWHLNQLLRINPKSEIRNPKQISNLKSQPPNPQKNLPYGSGKFRFYKLDIEDIGALQAIFKNKFDAVINLAARAGVRYSIENPYVYMRTNANGTLNLLELCKSHQVNKFILASTSSLYAGQPMPFKEDLPVNTPISPYAASKKAAEAICYTYHYLYDIDITILRYFTVYGPAGRPDMSVFRFIKWIMEDSSVEVFGDGTQERDFTYIADIVDGTVKALKPLNYEVINLGNNKPHKLSYMIELIEKYVGKRARLVYKDFYKADIKATWSDISKAKRLLDWEPKIGLKEGIKRTIEWFRENWDWVGMME